MKMRKNWHWIELIGFDNNAADLGVSAFLSRLAESPEGVSLLFSHIDFVNTFDACHTFDKITGKMVTVGDDHRRQVIAGKSCPNRVAVAIHRIGTTVSEVGEGL